MGESPAPVDARLLPAAAGAWAAAGIALGQPAAVGAAGAGVLVLVAAVLGLLARRRAARLPSHRAAAALALAVTGLVLAGTAAQVHARSTGVLARSGGQHVALVGTVVTEPRALATVQAWQTEPDHRLTVSAEQLEHPRAVGPARADAVAGEVLVIGPVAELRLGARVEVRGELVATDPADTAVAVLYTDDPPEVLAAPSGHLAAVEEVRAALRSVTAGLPPQAQGLVPGIAVGDDRALPAALEADMQVTGLTHLTAVSGAHVAILLGTVLAATSWLPRWGRITAGAAALVAFVALVRPEASVLRSGVMGVVVLLGLVLGRPARALPALGTAVVALLVADPWLARSYGFALSVLATGGLVLLSRPWARWLAHAMPRWAAHAVAVPAAAQAVCAPVILLLDPGVSTYAVPANLLVAPAVPPATVLGVGAALLAPSWPAAATAAATAAGWCTGWIAAVAGVFAGLPGARVGWWGGLGGAAALALATVLGVLLLRRTGPRVVVPVTLLGGAALLAVAALARPGWPPGGWVAAQCDVGQGAAFVARSGPGRAVLVDTGPAGGEVQRCLTDLDVTHLDLLVLSHAHADHVGGLADVLAAVSVSEALLGPGTAPTKNVDAALATLAEHAVPVGRPTAGETGRAGTVAWEVLWPTAGATAAAGGSQDAVNDLSAVVRVETPEVTAVALGDVEHAGQRGLLAQGPDVADVVVMAHHGSARQEPALAAALAPRLTLVGVGENDFGHPDPGAVALYTDGGSLVRRTDTCGDVAVVAGGGELAVVCRAGVAG